MAHAAVRRDLRAWAVLAVAVVAVAAAVVGVAEAVSPHPLTDLAVYRAAGDAVAHGGRVYLPPGDELVFTYPPPAAMLSVVLWPAPAIVTELVWTAAGLAVLVALVAVAFRRVLDRFAGPRLVLAVGGVALATLLLAPVMQTVFLGQVNLLLAGLVVADLVVARAWWPRGALIGLATAVKLTPGLFAVYLWISGRRRAALTAAATFAAAGIVALVLVPRATREYWTDVVFDGERLGRVDATANQSVRGLAGHLLPAVAQVPVWLVGAAALAVVGLARARRAHALGNEVAAIAIVGLLSALVSPVGWNHHLVWVVFALGALVGDGRDRVGVAWAVVVATLVAVPVPWLGDRLVDGREGAAVEALGAVLRSGPGLVAIALVLALPLDRLDGDPARRPTVGAARSGRVDGADPVDPALAP